MSTPENVEVHILANQRFFDLINNIITPGQESITNFEHVKNALELYANVIQEIQLGNKPVILCGDNIHIHPIPLPENLEKFYSSKHPQPQDKFNFRKSIL